jgi:hypothetical protein
MMILSPHTFNQIPNCSFFSFLSIFLLLAFHFIWMKKIQTGGQMDDWWSENHSTKKEKTLNTDRKNFCQICLNDFDNQIKSSFWFKNPKTIFH